jgi:DNA-binding response OmpR family regulator
MANILIVEDEISISDLIMMNLRLVGHTCLQAFDGNAAVTALQEFRPDLVLLDVMLPYKNGFSLMEEKAFAHIPVIFLTAKVSTHDKVKGLKLGADDYIIKPFEAVELLARLLNNS